MGTALPLINLLLGEKFSAAHPAVVELPIPSETRP